MKKYFNYVVYTICIVSLCAVGVLIFVNNSSGKLDLEKQQLERERDQYLAERKALSASNEMLTKQYRTLKSKYLQAIKEYEETKKPDDYNSAVDSFFSGE
jgi:cell division protein FtsB